MPTLVADRATPIDALPPRLLCAIAVDAARAARFGAHELEAGARDAVRVTRSETHDVWLIRWSAGSGTEMHDHGGSAGAIHVVSGALVEYRPGLAATPIRRRVHSTGAHQSFPAAMVHKVVNESRSVAQSIHVYSPPLHTMHHYEIHDRTGLRIARRELIVDG